MRQMYLYSRVFVLRPILGKKFVRFNIAENCESLRINRFRQFFYTTNFDLKQMATIELKEF